MKEKLRINDKDVDDLLDFVGVDNAGGIMFNYQGKPFSGIIEYYNEQGVLMGEEEFTDGHVGGLQRGYHPNGQLKEEYMEFFGNIAGIERTWDEKGKLIRETLWKDGAYIKKIL